MVRKHQNEQGVILIALLWVLMALCIIALSFSRDSFIEVAAARNSQNLSDAYYVARAGIFATVYRFMERRYTPRVQGIELETPDPLDRGEIVGDFAGGAYRVVVEDESSKINLNFVTEEHLRALFRVLGIGDRDADVMVDSIMDWRDVDTAHRMNGAEDDYYQSLPRPYKAKNGRIETVEELLLIRGVTPEYYHGFQDREQDGTPVFRYGLSRYCTVYSFTYPRINVNYAALPVLQSIPGMSPSAAELIYQRAKIKPFKSVAEITQEIPATLGALTLPFLSTEQTGIYTFTASAQMLNSKVRRVIRTVISLDPREATGYKVIYWNENSPSV